MKRAEGPFTAPSEDDLCSPLCLKQQGGLASLLLRVFIYGFISASTSVLMSGGSICVEKLLAMVVRSPVR